MTETGSQRGQLNRNKQIFHQLQTSQTASEGTIAVITRMMKKLDLQTCLDDLLAVSSFLTLIMYSERDMYNGRVTKNHFHKKWTKGISCEYWIASYQLVAEVAAGRRHSRIFCLHLPANSAGEIPRRHVLYKHLVWYWQPESVNIKCENSSRDK